MTGGFFLSIGGLFILSRGCYISMGGFIGRLFLSIAAASMDMRLHPPRMRLPQIGARSSVFDYRRFIVTGGFFSSISGLFVLSRGCFISMRGFLFGRAASENRPAASYF